LATEKNMGVRTRLGTEKNKNLYPNVTSIMGVGVTDLSLTVNTLFPMTIESATCLNRSLESLREPNAAKKQK